MKQQVQANDEIRKRFLKALNSGEVEDGCKIVIHVVSLTANAACYVPDVTISKVACAAGTIVNITSINPYDPNTPNLISDAGVKVCQLTYATADTGIKFTFEYYENQTEEIKKTWNWLNTLEGGVFFLEYISNN